MWRTDLPLEGTWNRAAECDAAGVEDSSLSPNDQADLPPKSVHVRIRQLSSAPSPV